MPYSTPGRIKYVTNGGTVLTHNNPARIGTVVGAAIKQRAVAFDAGIAAQNQIQAAEEFAILAKGVVEFSTATGEPGVALAAAAQGDPVYITAAHVLTTSNAGGAIPFGRVHEVVNQDRGVPADRIRIDLDAKDTVAP